MDNTQNAQGVAAPPVGSGTSIGSNGAAEDGWDLTREETPAAGTVGKPAKDKSRKAAEVPSADRTLLGTVKKDMVELLQYVRKLEERCQAVEARVEGAPAGVLPLTEEMVKALQAPLPPEAIRPNEDHPHLSAITPMFVYERLNQVFGMGGWEHKVRIVEGNLSSPMIVVEGCLEIKRYGIVRWSFGGNAMKDRGDAYKGAKTDSLTKAASEIGIGQDIFKGSKPPETQKSMEEAERAAMARNAAAERRPQVVKKDKPAAAVAGKAEEKPAVPAAELVPMVAALPVNAPANAPASAPVAPAASAKPLEPEANLVCQDCGGAVVEVVRGGTRYSAAQVAELTRKAWSRTLCGSCHTKAKDKSGPVR